MVGNITALATHRFAWIANPNVTTQLAKQIANVTIQFAMTAKV